MTKGSSLALSACLRCTILIAVPLDGQAQIYDNRSDLAPLHSDTLDYSNKLSKYCNPYSFIVKRNIFGLSDAAPSSPPLPSPPNGASPAAIKFTGFFKIPDEPLQAIFSLPKDPNGNATSIILAEGQRVGDLELVKIIVANDEARVINAGNVLSLSLEDGKSIAPAPDDGRPVPGPWLSGPQPRRFPP